MEYVQVSVTRDIECGYMETSCWAPLSKGVKVGDEVTLNTFPTISWKIDKVYKGIKDISEVPRNQSLVVFKKDF
jgi:hypothetical protein